MIEVNNVCELNLIDGGLSISGTLINAFTGGIKIVLELGRSLGSAIRRGSSRKYCSL